MPTTYTLANSPAEVVQRLLIELAVATDPDLATVLPWAAYFSREPDQGAPESCITVYDTTGQADGRTFPDGESVTHHGFQVRVRSTNARQGWVRADLIRDKFSRSVEANVVAVPASADTPAATYLVHAVVRIGNVIAIGKDKPRTGRNLFTLNALLAGLRQLT